MRRIEDKLINYLEEIAYKIRKYSIEMITYGGIGHCGGSLSIAEILACLYFHEMCLDPNNPHWEDRDRFILSKAHCCPALYVALALKGFFKIDELYSYGKLKSRLQSHTDMLLTPGVEISGGSLGQGLSIAAGMAYGLRKYKKNSNNGVYCLIGDGEVNEGQIWEAAMFSANYSLDNLIGIIDYNKVMAKGFISEQMNIEPIVEKWHSFGWEVIEIDGHDIVELLQTFYKARYINVRGRPTMIIAHTIKGWGVDWMEFNYQWHTHAPSPEEADDAIRQISRKSRKKEEGYSKLEK